MPPDKPSHEPDANRESAPQLGQHELAWLIAATRQRISRILKQVQQLLQPDS
jgi:hypothetical protein